MDPDRPGFTTRHGTRNIRILPLAPRVITGQCQGLLLAAVWPPIHSRSRNQFFCNAASPVQCAAPRGVRSVGYLGTWVPRSCSSPCRGVTRVGRVWQRVCALRRNSGGEARGGEGRGAWGAGRVDPAMTGSGMYAQCSCPRGTLLCEFKNPPQSGGVAFSGPWLSNPAQPWLSSAQLSQARLVAQGGGGGK